VNSSHLSRRELLGILAALPLQGISTSDPWQESRAILGRIKEPKFPNRDFKLTTYNGDINAAISAASAAGGGRVVVPSGNFLTGPIRLKSRVNLYLSEGAVLKFSTNARDYLPLVFTRFEGTEVMNYSPFIYAFEQKDVAITGSGVLDGQADAGHWWDWARKAERNRLVSLASSGRPVAERVFGDGGFLRPNFIQPYRCQNVFVEGITIRNSPMWEIHPVLCSNVIVRGVTIDSHGPNNDGCDPESCRDVLVEKCTFDTGDDCIALKSGRNNDGRRVGKPVENVIVRDCVMKDGHGGVTIGSEISGGARNIFVEGCRMDSPQLDRALRLKSNSQRGGVIERVYMRNATVGQVKEAIVSIDFNYEEGDNGDFPPVVRNVEVRDVTSSKSQYALYLRGFPRAVIQDVRLTDCTFDNVAKPDVIENVRDIVLKNVKVNGSVVNKSITKL
jgi:polygalacturonase